MMTASGETAGTGADREPAGQAAVRLEAALDRIARARPGGGGPARHAEPDPEARRALSARLDGLIAELRAVLGRTGAD